MQIQVKKQVQEQQKKRKFNWKKMLMIFGGISVLLVVVVAVLGFLSSTPLTKAQATEHLNNYFSKIAEKAGKEGNDHFSGVQVQVLSRGKDLNFSYSSGIGKRLEGSIDANNLDGLTAETPFHVASVGKLMTATLIYQLIDTGKLTLDQPVESILPEAMLDKLFVLGEEDYRSQVTIEQLLAHTSGVADYFGGPVVSGKTMAVILKEEPNRLWRPDDLLAFSRDFQVPNGVPGAGYHYSDTGYILLGKIVEVVTGDTFERALTEQIFEPLNMTDTYMMMRQEPLSGNKAPIADIWLEGEEMGDRNSLSVDWAGGGLISTLKDLTAFSDALHGGKLIADSSYKAMFSDRHVFEQGIYTGAGGMTLHFEKFFPLLKLPKINGHIGVLSTHVFYDAISDTHIVMNFGSTDKMVASFTALIEIMNTLGRIK